MRGEFENIFKEKFKGHTENVSEGLFESIINKRNKRKKAIIWMFSLLGILVLIGTFSLFNISQDPAKSTLADDVQHTTDNKTNQNQLNETSTNPVKPGIEESNNIVLDDISKVENSTQVDNKKIDASTNKVSTARNESNKTLITNSIDKNLEPSSNNLNQEYAQLYREITNNGISNPEKTQVFNRNKDLTDIYEEIKNKKESRIAVPKTQHIDSAKSVVTNLDITKDQQNKGTVSSSNPDSSNIDPPKFIPSNWSIGLFAGPSFHANQYSGDPNLSESFTESQKGVSSFSTGINVIYDFNEKWNVTSGVNLIKTKNQIDYTITNTSYNYSYRTETQTVIHPVLGEIEKEVTIETIDTINKDITFNSKNSTQTIFVPLNVERKFTVGDKLTLFASAGGSLSLNNKVSGQYLNIDSLGLFEMEALPYKKNGLTSLNIGFGLGYTLNNRISLLVYPRANLGLRSSLNSSYGLKQNEFKMYNQLGIRINL